MNQKKSALLTGLLAIAAAEEERLKTSGEYVLTNPYAGLDPIPSMFYSKPTSRKKPALSNKQKKARKASSNAKKARKNNRKKR